jgi:hypothetical protein
LPGGGVAAHCAALLEEAEQERLQPCPLEEQPLEEAVVVVLRDRCDLAAYVERERERERETPLPVRYTIVLGR